MGTEIIQFIVSQVGLAGITYLALIMIERSNKESLRREAEVNAQQEFLLKRVLDTLERNSEVNAALVHALNASLPKIFPTDKKHD